MNNIESKYNSLADASKIITRVLYAYIVISIARVLLYTGFKIFSDNSLFVEGGFIYINADTLNMSSIVALIIYGILTLIFLIVSVVLFACYIKTIGENTNGAKVGKLMWAHIIAMIADILIAIGFACAVIILDTFALIMIALSVVEISFFVWLIIVRKNNEEEQ